MVTQRQGRKCARILHTHCAFTCTSRPLTAVSETISERHWCTAVPYVVMESSSLSLANTPRVDRQRLPHRAGSLLWVSTLRPLFIFCSHSRRLFASDGKPNMLKLEAYLRPNGARSTKAILRQGVSRVLGRLQRELCRIRFVPTGNLGKTLHLHATYRMATPTKKKSLR